MQKTTKVVIVMLVALFYTFCSNANPVVSNLVEQEKYFINHEKQLGEIKNRLSLYRHAGVVGVSGIGKTQIARMYAYSNRGDYRVIWFFDCNLDLSDQFVALAKTINSKLGLPLSDKIDETPKNAKMAVMGFLAPRKDWLLVFDNLRVNQNDKLSEILEWSHNGHIIICSQDAKNLNEVVQIPYLTERDSILLAGTILGKGDINLITELVKTFKGYPMLVAQGAMFLNNNKGLLATNPPNFRQSV